MPFLWIVIGIAWGYYPFWTLLGWLVLPISMQNVRRAWMFLQKGYETIAHLDERTAQLQLLFSLIFSLSFLISRLVG